MTKLARFTEAEAILVEMADAGLKDTTAYKDDKTKAIQRVVDFYDTWHAAEPDAGLDSTGPAPLPQKAAEWRAKLPKATTQPATKPEKNVE